MELEPKQVAMIFKYFADHGNFARIRINGIIALDEEVLELLSDIHNGNAILEDLVEGYNYGDYKFELNIITR